MAFQKYACTTLEKGLYLVEQKGAKNYRAKASLFGKTPTVNTGFSDFIPAQKFARSWFRGLKRRLEGDPREGAFLDAADGFIKSLPSETTRDFYQRKLHALAPRFQNVDLVDVTTKFLADFLKARRAVKTRLGTQISNNTLKKDFVFIRLSLSWAVNEALLTTIPLFPKVGKIESNPRGWLEYPEWKKLEKVALDRLDDPGLTARTKAQRQELYDFIVMMVYTCARVSELLRLRVMDCSVDMATVGEFTRRHLFVGINGGKTGPRTALGWPPAVDAFERIKERRNLSSTDLLFEAHHRDGFRELLVAAKLRMDRDGKTRNLKSLRSTGLMLRVVASKGVDSALLARHAGTSIEMLDKYYLKPLTVVMNPNQLAAPNDKFFLLPSVVFDPGPQKTSNKLRPKVSP